MTRGPKRSVAYNFRYASGLALLAFMYFSDRDTIASLAKEYSIAALPVLTGGAIIAGIIIYYVYRAFFYLLFLALCDWLGADNQRNYFRSIYIIPGGPIRSTETAEQLFSRMTRDIVMTEREEWNNAAIHFFYQCSLISLAMTIWHSVEYRFAWMCVFVLLGSFFWLAAHRLNNRVERDQLLVVKGHRREMDVTARLMGLTKRSAPKRRSSRGGDDSPSN